MKKINWSLFIYGFLAWLVPFVISFLFFTAQGQLKIDQQLFKSIMVVVGGLVGAWLMVRYFGKVKSRFAAEGVTVGIVWLLMSWLLDLLILVPMAKMSLVFYFNTIGLLYLTIPIMSISMGWILEKKK